MLAEEVHSGQILRCDVIVDVINSLSITTTTRELFMHEAPEAFEVRAYDNQGNYIWEDPICSKGVRPKLSNISWDFR